MPRSRNEDSSQPAATYPNAEAQFSDLNEMKFRDKPCG